MTESNCLFIFRNDLRVYDNTALIEASKNHKNVYPIFIFTGEQIKNNKFKSNNCIQFMCESLRDLSHQTKGKLILLYDKNDGIKTISKILNNSDKINSIYVNADYTPYSINRDKKIQKLCEKNNVIFKSFDDRLLCCSKNNENAMNLIKNNNGDPYLVYGAFKKAFYKIKINKPNNYKVKNLKQLTHFSNEQNINKLNFLNDINQFYIQNKNIFVNGGRKNGLKHLKKLPISYKQTRDTPSINTTNLSAYNKFGCLSIREVYQKFKLTNSHKVLKDQLIWRDFYYYLLYYFPHSQNYNFKKNIKIKWSSNDKHLQAWKDGKTGYPIVDAGMRQLNETGYMHNRLRLITSMFLVKVLLINWKEGETYFAQKLVDYDPAQNCGNWNWVASTGVDSLQFGPRIFNPIQQSKKFDKNGKYILRWIPELKNENIEDLHNPDKLKNYIKPIILPENLDIQKNKFIQNFNKKNEKIK